VLPARKNDVLRSYSIAGEQADEIERLNRLIQVMLSQQQDRAVTASGIGIHEEQEKRGRPSTAIEKIR
jgi:hypothetical protein